MSILASLICKQKEFRGSVYLDIYRALRLLLTVNHDVKYQPASYLQSQHETARHKEVFHQLPIYLKCLVVNINRFNSSV